MTIDLELSPGHEQFRRSVRDFAEAEIAPHAAQWDRDHHFPTDVVQKMGKLGLMGLTAPRSSAAPGWPGTDEQKQTWLLWSQASSWPGSA